MNRKMLSLLGILLTPLFPGRTAVSQDWIVEKHPAYTFHCTAADTVSREEYARRIDEGIASVQKFFDGSFRNEFKVFIHPHRTSLDSQWRKDWKKTDFKPECWMVASGIADKLDMLSPKRWDAESCEHRYGDSIKTQQLITHELVHVYHGQLNASPDFSDVTGVDWFVEGVASYASGQCDAGRIAEIQKALSGKKITMNLENFWTGNLKYELAGSMVMYIDWTYGRKKLQRILKFNRKAEVLNALDVTEADLLAGWEKFIARL